MQKLYFFGMVYKRSLENDMSKVDSLIDEVGEWLKKAATSTSSVYAIRLSIEELVTNVIKYGYSDDAVHVIDIKVVIKESEIVLEIWDDSDKFDLCEVKDPDTTSSLSEREVGGLGVHLVRKIAKSFTSSREGKKNHTVVVVDF